MTRILCIGISRTVGERQVEVVRHLLRGPDRQAPVRLAVRDDGVRLGEGVRDADELEVVRA